VFVEDIPGGHIGRLPITAPPTIEPIRDGSDRVLLSIRFRSNFEPLQDGEVQGACLGDGFGQELLLCRGGTLASFELGLQCRFETMAQPFERGD
jgi:hypothetical protein